MAKGRKKKPSLASRFRSAISGRFVTERYGKSHPKTTVRESSKKKR